MDQKRTGEQGQTEFRRGLFDRIAPMYDFLNHVISAGKHVRWKRQAVNLLAPQEGEAILDLCSGSGDIVALLLEQEPAVTVNAVDFSSKMLQIATQRFKDQKQVTFFQADAQDVPFAAAVFDGVIISFGLRNLASIEKGLAEIYRVLKPHGRFVCIDFGRPDSLLFKLAFYAYFAVGVTLIGMLWGKSAEYAYLYRSIRAFPPPETLKARMEKIGFSEVGVQAVFGGFVAIWSAQKPA